MISSPCCAWLLVATAVASCTAPSAHNALAAKLAVLHCATAQAAAHVGCAKAGQDCRNHKQGVERCRQQKLCACCQQNLGTKGHTRPTLLVFYVKLKASYVKGNSFLGAPVSTAAHGQAGRLVGYAAVWRLVDPAAAGAGRLNCAGLWTAEVCTEWWCQDWPSAAGCLASLSIRTSPRLDSAHAPECTLC